MDQNLIVVNVLSLFSVILLNFISKKKCADGVYYLKPQYHFRLALLIISIGSLGLMLSNKASISIPLLFIFMGIIRLIIYFNFKQISSGNTNLKLVFYRNETISAFIMGIVCKMADFSTLGVLLIFIFGAIFLFQYVVMLKGEKEKN